MRITPDPYEGLHPAIVHKPPPLSSSPWTICPAVGGCLGVLGWALGRAIKRPGLGTRTAAWSTSAYLILNLSSSEYVKRRRINPFLESKGIKVPKSKLVERTLDIDQDNFIILGMLVGIGTAGARRQPWAVFGWQRFVGALSFGAAGGAILSPLVDQQRYVAAFQRLEREREVAKLYEPEMKAFMMQNFFGKEDAQPADQPSSSMTPLQKLLKQAGPAGMQSPQGPPFDRLGAPQMPLFDANLDKDIDDEDPQPHLSEMRDGERIFKPNTNYTWSAGADAIPKLEEHIKLLRTRRSQLAKEAELLWHDLAAKEAVYYEIPIQAKEKADVRSMLQNMNHVHINLWLEIGMLDWMIADSNKNILQIKAMNKKSHWLPPEPKRGEVAPTLTLKILRELEREISGALQEVDFVKDDMVQAMNNPDTKMLDAETGEPVPDPHASIKRQMEELEKLREGAALDAENLHKLIAQAEERVDDAKK